MWVADPHRPTLCDGTHHVWNQSIRGPIATAYNVASTTRANSNTVLFIFFRVEVGVTVGRGHQLCASLAVAVGIKATHGLVLTVAPHPLTVLIALVTGNVYDRFHGRRATHCLK